MAERSSVAEYKGESIRARASLGAEDAHSVPMESTGWQTGSSVRRNWAVVLCLSLAFTVLLLRLPSSRAQEADDFISINCGGGSFTDPTTGIEWSAEEKYFESLDYVVEEGAAEAVEDIGNRTVIVNEQVMKTARAFFQTSFLGPSSATLCLAAISSIELRPLALNLYTDGRYDSSIGERGRLEVETYLMTIARLNFGPNTSDPPIRFPSDPYDRIWYPYTPDNKDSASTTADDFLNDHLPNLEVPIAVLQTAWVGELDDRGFPNSSLSYLSDLERLPSFDSFYAAEYFYDVESGISMDTRMVDTYVMPLRENEENNLQVYEWALNTPVLSNMSHTVWKSRRYVDLDFLVFRWWAGLERSGFPPIVNAFELYGEIQASNSRVSEAIGGLSTSQADALKNLTRNFNLKFLDISGDPCVPVPWSWIGCTTYHSFSELKKLDLSKKGVNGSLEHGFSEELNLSLEFLDLSHNNLFGCVPENLFPLLFRGTLILDNNNLSGFNFSSSSFNDSYRSVRVLSLSLRHNNFTTEGLMPLFRTAERDLSLRALYLGYKKLSGPIPEEMGNLIDTEELDLSHNFLTGELSSQLSRLEGLTSLDLSYNSLGGSLPVRLTKLQQLSYLDFSGNRYVDDNKLTELDLTHWCRTVEITETYATFEQQISLTKNNITTLVLPGGCRSLNLNKTIWETSSQTNQGFILLADNPWCKSLKLGTRTQVERYLCRSNPLADFWNPDEQPLKKGISMKVLITIIVVGSAFVLTISAILLATFWRYHQRLKVLRLIQKDLAKEDVRPPFLNYEILKSATNNFAKESELGRGAFGAVYKALQPDGTVLAVKQLFPNSQNMADFLKEMVLISGIKHKNLVQLKGCCVRDEKRFLIYEYVENKNLADALWGDSRKKLSWERRKKICIGIARGLSYLHEELHPKIIHRDIKPQNILLDIDWNTKIADFGLARPVHEVETQKTMNIGGTRGYLSPEYATVGVVSEKLDVYSYGILVLEIISGRHCIGASLPSDEFYIRDWAMKLLRENRLLEAAEDILTASTSSEEILAVLNVALACVQEKPGKRPLMTEVVVMLSGQPKQLAMDIVNELKDQHSLHTHTNLFSDMSATGETVESDQTGLLLSYGLDSQRSFGSYPCSRATTRSM